MSTSLPILFILAALVLLTGALSLVSIVLVAKRCRKAQKPIYPDRIDESDGVDPWKEAGKRVKNDMNEPT